MAYLKDWRRVRPDYNSCVTSTRAVQDAWTKPAAGLLKLNVDASVQRDTNHAGLGWIIRDDHGMFVAAQSVMFAGIFSPREAEALAVREALSWLKTHGWDGVVVETDAELLITSLHRPNLSPFGLLLEDISLLLSSFHNIVFRHIRRSANSVAHLLARYAFSYSTSMAWFDSGPSFISVAVAQDMNIS
ncbi:uncharacterized protein LOC116025477 [Ipomoea triloba]|uniref:uncharacterized protein LOC116025477 n=1 Tax=Ipomoea triloba TaxID=35885 RepID=UPI00125D8922|nr:uncharacterized protein LOC116025477 [Ipomoea triloba]